jgi:large subunit ribosomal protein L4
MPIVDVFNIKATAVTQVNLPDEIYNIPVNKAVLHEVVTMLLAGKRSGTASVRRRSNVKGSTRKLFRQKGTGRARRGDIKSPLLRGGGSVFGPSPKSWAYTIPKKKRKLALKMALSSKFQDNELIILDEFSLEQPKTKQFVEIMKSLESENALIVIETESEVLDLSSRNVSSVKLMRYEGLNVYDILKFKKLVLLQKSLEGIERRLQA